MTAAGGRRLIGRASCAATVEAGWSSTARTYCLSQTRRGLRSGGLLRAESYREGSSLHKGEGRGSARGGRARSQQAGLFKNGGRAFFFLHGRS